MITMMTGLSTAQAVSLLAQVGPNALPERRRDPVWRRFVRQFQSPLIYILPLALVFDAGLWTYEGAHGWPIEALAIGIILLLNAALGLYQEQRSEAALARLKALAAAQAWVLRDGRLVRLASTALVPGDWVRLEAGDRVPADGTLVDTHGTMLDEAMLTGESVPVDKAAGDDAFSGTLMKALLALGVLGLVAWMGYDLDATRATAFHFMAVGQLFLTYPSRHTWTHPLPNRYLHAAVLGGIAIQVAAAWLPLTSRLLGNASIPAALWLVVFGGAGLSWALAEGTSRVVWRRKWHP